LRIYIFQKYYEVFRSVIYHSDYEHAYQVFIHLKRSTNLETLKTKHDKDLFEFIEEYFEPKGNKNLLDKKAKIILIYFLKNKHNELVISIWEARNTLLSNVIYSIYATASTLILAILIICIIIYSAPDVNNQKIACFFCIETKASTCARAYLFICMVLGGILGGSISAISVSRQDENKASMGTSKVSIPFLKIDWIRPLLGGFAGLISGLTIISIKSDSDTQLIVVALSVAAGFSERFLYTSLDKSATHIDEKIANTTGLNTNNNAQ